MGQTSRQNLNTSLRRKRSRRPPMQEYDALPPELRRWLSQAALQWAARPVLAAWHKALRENGGCAQGAIANLNAVEARLLARDAAKTWGKGHPVALSGNTRDAQTQKAPTL